MILILEFLCTVPVNAIRTKLKTFFKKIAGESLPAGGGAAVAAAGGDPLAELEALAVPAGVVADGRAEPTDVALAQRLASLQAGAATRGTKRPAGGGASRATQRRRRSRSAAVASRAAGKGVGRVAVVE